MDIFGQIVEKIITDQEMIIGPLALEQAKKISGLEITGSRSVKISGNAKDVVTHLVDQYALLFGRASIEVCKDAVRELVSTLPKDQVPTVLQN